MLSPNIFPLNIDYFFQHLENQFFRDTLIIELGVGNFIFFFFFSQQNQEISDLTVRLNQSIATVEELQQEIKHLKKENKKLLKNLSSYHETAKLEMKRKEQEITSLQQKYV